MDDIDEDIGDDVDDGFGQKRADGGGGAHDPAMMNLIDAASSEREIDDIAAAIAASLEEVSSLPTRTAEEGKAEGEDTEEEDGGWEDLAEVDEWEMDMATSACASVASVSPEEDDEWERLTASSSRPVTYAEALALAGLPSRGASPPTAASKKAPVAPTQIRRRRGAATASAAEWRDPESSWLEMAEDEKFAAGGAYKTNARKSKQQSASRLHRLSKNALMKQRRA